MPKLAYLPNGWGYRYTTDVISARILKWLSNTSVVLGHPNCRCYYQALHDGIHFHTIWLKHEYWTDSSTRTLEIQTNWWCLRLKILCKKNDADDLMQDWLSYLGGTKSIIRMLATKTKGLSHQLTNNSHSTGPYLTSRSSRTRPTPSHLPWISWHQLCHCKS